MDSEPTAPSSAKAIENFKEVRMTYTSLIKLPFIFEGGNIIVSKETLKTLQKSRANTSLGNDLDSAMKACERLEIKFVEEDTPTKVVKKMAQKALDLIFFLK